MSDVVPLDRREKRRAPEPPPIDGWKPPKSISEDDLVLAHLSDLVSGRVEFDVSATSEHLEAQVKGLPPTVMDRLRRGLFPVQDHLDLHGMTLEQAEKAIYQFITHSVELGRCCLLIIHGRGHRSPDGVPIIKRNLENLLLRRPVKRHILAFSTAKPVDGGSGASYVLLRS
jgi:DNA-nicking Smr family endonuclease